MSLDGFRWRKTPLLKFRHVLSAPCLRRTAGLANLPCTEVRVIRRPGARSDQADHQRPIPQPTTRSRVAAASASECAVVLAVSAHVSTVSSLTGGSRGATLSRDNWTKIIQTNNKSFFFAAPDSTGKHFSRRVYHKRTKRNDFVWYSEYFVVIEH